MIGWYIIEHDDKEILEIKISKEQKNMFVEAEHFMSNVVDDYGSDPISTDGGSWNQFKQINS